MVDFQFRVDVEIFEDKRCEEMQAHSAKEMICAGRFGGGKDACQGDSGKNSSIDVVRGTLSRASIGEFENF